MVRGHGRPLPGRGGGDPVPHPEGAGGSGAGPRGEATGGEASEGKPTGVI